MKNGLRVRIRLRALYSANITWKTVQLVWHRRASDVTRLDWTADLPTCLHRLILNLVGEVKDYGRILEFFGCLLMLPL